MTRDDVIRMAAEACGEFRLTGAVMFGADELQLFAEKVADSVIESVAQHLETSSDRHRRDYFAAKVRELKTQAPAQPAGQDRIDGERYRWLREQDIDLRCPDNGILKTGIFIGMIPHNLVLSGDDADAAIDAAMKGESK